MGSSRSACFDHFLICKPHHIEEIVGEPISASKFYMKVKQEHVQKLMHTFAVHFVECPRLGARALLELASPLVLTNHQVSRELGATKCRNNKHCYMLQG